MRTSHEQLLQWMAEPEGQRLEFKEAKSTYSLDKLAAYCVALANEGGGKVILGVTDERPRRIVGTAAFAEPGNTEFNLHAQLSHRIPVEELQCLEGRVLVVHVPPRLPGTAWQLGGRYFKRAGDALVGMGDAELRAVFAETGPDFSAETCPGAMLADLSPEAIALFRERWAKKSGDARKAKWTDVETLANAELLVDGQITYAALILLGTHAALGRHLAQAELVFEYRSSEASGPAADRTEYRAGFMVWQDALWAQINLRNDRQSYQDDFFRMDVPTFDEKTVREATLNAVAHRDYRLGGSIFVRQFRQRLEVVSPGGLPTGITPENILDEQNPRNRRLAEALGKCGLIDRSGQGLNMMVERAVLQSKPLPSFAGTAAHQVRLTLEGGVRNPAFVRFMERLDADAVRNFSTRDYLALECLQHEKTLPPALKDRLPGLVAAGAVETVGRGQGVKHLLSRGFHAALGEKGVYTRKKGLDRNTNKALLLQHIEDNKHSGSKMDELQQVLPALSRSQIQVLLRELRKDGAVHSIGRTNGARWHPGTEPPAIAT